MINAYLNQDTIEPIEIHPENQSLLKNAIWIDLLAPTRDEEKLIEDFIHLEIPTREEMQDIALSSRLYIENDILYMTAMMIADSQSSLPKYDAVTFILTEDKLITIRYIEPLAFKFFATKIKKSNIKERTSINFFIEFLEISVDRLADILEFIGRNLECTSKVIFRDNNTSSNPHPDKLDYQSLLRDIGKTGDLNSKVRESLVTFNLLITFFKQLKALTINQELSSKIISLLEDINSLKDHANFISTKVNFLLDATLGMVNIEQNNIIKIFSIAAVIFLPPTLIASIYGMNFGRMPELTWEYGYPFALGLLLISAWLPYKFFKLKKWL